VIPREVHCILIQFRWHFFASIDGVSGVGNIFTSGGSSAWSATTSSPLPSSGAMEAVPSSSTCMARPPIRQLDHQRCCRSRCCSAAAALPLPRPLRCHCRCRAALPLPLPMPPPLLPPPPLRCRCRCRFHCHCPALLPPPPLRCRCHFRRRYRCRCRCRCRRRRRCFLLFECFVSTPEPPHLETLHASQVPSQQRWTACRLLDALSVQSSEVAVVGRAQPTKVGAARGSGSGSLEGQKRLCSVSIDSVYHSVK